MITRQEILKDIAISRGIFLLSLSKVAQTDNISCISGDIQGNHEKQQCRVTIEHCDRLIGILFNINKF